MPGRRDIAILDSLLEKARSVAEEAEVFHLEQVDTPVRFEANRVKSIETRELAGSALRIIREGRIGFSATTNLSDPDSLVRGAAEVAPFGAQARFQFPGPESYPEVPVYDSAVEQTPLEQMVQLGQSVVDGVRAYSSEVQVEGTVSRSVQTVTMMNTRGGRFQYTKTTYGLGFEGTIIRGTDMLFVSDRESSCHPLKDASAVVASIVRQLEYARETAVVASKTMPVIFTPFSVASVLLSPLLTALNGRTVLQGTSPLGEKLGQQIVDPRFALIDDPTIPFIPGSRFCDDEGTPSRRLPLIERGVAANFLYDLQTAGQAGAVSTGSAGRGISSPPGPSAGLLLVQEGDATLEQLMATMGEGLVVERLLGAGQSNILGGDFNANVLLGYKVEAGRVVGRVKDCMVSGNAYQALNNLLGIGSEARWVGGSLHTPPIGCAEVRVSTKT